MKINRLKLTTTMIAAGVDSSKQLAALAGISVNTVSRIINGSGATLPVIRKIADALGVKPADIIQEEVNS